MTLTNRQKYDYHDIDPWELKLIRVGHSLWAQLRRQRRQNCRDVREETALEAAIEIIVQAKAEKRAELREQRAAEGTKVKAYFAGRKVVA